MIPVIFKPGEKDFTTNGLGRLVDATRCEITEEAKSELNSSLSAVTLYFRQEMEWGKQYKTPHI